MNELIYQIERGNYNVAKNICDRYEDKMVSDYLYKYVEENQNISIYSFVNYMADTTKKEIWYDLEFLIMGFEFVYIEGAYSVALFHAKEALELFPSAEKMETLLFFYGMPEQLVKKEEAIEIAKRIIEIKPDSLAAKKVLNSI